MNGKPIDPTTGNIFAVFFGYAFPSIIGMLAMSCAVVVDGFFLGNYAGTRSLASVNLTMPAIGVLFGLALMLSVGGAIRCGKFLGSGNVKSASYVFSQTVVFIFLSSATLTTLGVANIDRLVIFLGATPDLAPAVSEYLQIILIFLCFQLGAVCLSYFIRAARLPMIVLTAMAAGSVVNIVLDYLFIVQLQMGHKGAALGTGLAETTTFAFLCLPFLTGRTALVFRWRRKDLVEVFKAAGNGLPELFNEVSLGIFMIFFNWMIMKNLGQTGIAAFAIINYVLFAGLIVSYGVGDALQSVVSQNYGASKHRRVKRFMIISAASVTVVGVAISTLLALAPQAVSALFIQSGAAKTAQLTTHFLAYVWPAFLFNGINIVVVAYLTALNRCFDSTVIILAKNLVLPVAFLFILQFMIGKDAIFVVLPLAETATLFLGLFLLHKNRRIKLVSDNRLNRQVASRPALA